MPYDSEMQKVKRHCISSNAKMCTACRRPKPFMAPGTSMMSGHDNLIPSKVKTNLLLLRASSESLKSCRIIFLQVSGRVVKSVIVLLGT